MIGAQQPEALRFTKKPVTIVASQWFKSGDHPAVRDISDSDDLFFTGMGGATLVEREKFGVIGTLESPNHLVTPGDWIIRGVKGELYPCKPDIFEATYTPETKLQQGKCLADKYEVEGFLQDHRFAKDHWCRQAAAELRRLNSCVNEFESEAQANARIIGASAENELALRARVQELQRRVAKLENELSARGTWHMQLKPVAWMHEDTFYNMQNTARSEKTRWLVYNLSEHHSTSGMIPLYVAPLAQEKM